MPARCWRLGLGLARPSVPSLEHAHLTEDGAVGGLVAVDEHAEEAVLACVLGLLATSEEEDVLRDWLAALWPGHSNGR